MRSVINDGALLDEGLRDLGLGIRVVCCCCVRARVRFRALGLV